MRCAFPTALLLGAAACGVGGGDTAYPLDDTLRLNHIQAMGSHNSYHVLDGPPASAEYDYEHAPLDVQLDQQGVRQLELDLHLGRTSGALEVYHIPPVDMGTTCLLFRTCLTRMREWSEAHRSHHLVLVFIEPKDDLAVLSQLAGNPEDFDELPLAGELDRIDSALLDVLGPTKLFTPDDLRGDHDTVAEAIASDGWPTLGRTRGRFAFVLLDDGAHHEEYTGGRAGLRGRVMFATAPIEAHYAAFVKLDDPLGDADRIADALARRLIVRTRAESSGDADEGASGRRDAAYAVGAHFVSTDFPVPDPRTGYAAAVPGGTPSRCNPVTAPPECTTGDIERGLFGP